MKTRKKRTFKHLTYHDRLQIEAMYNNKISIEEIAKFVECSTRTIYKELHRGKCKQLNSDYTEKEIYSAQLSQSKTNYLSSGKGKELKISHDIKYANFIEHMIADKGYSPEATLLFIKTHKIKFNHTISFKTLYRYIDKGVFLRITNKNLPTKGKKRKIKKVRPVQKRKSAGTSIEKRPKKILKRNEFGNWEMDTVKGIRGKTKGCLLVLSERKTRMELVIKMKDQKSDSVVMALNRIENIYKDKFSKIFKTITVDNGVEFADCEGIENSILNKGKKRTILYYCHAYCSYERGTNENINRMIRRKAPKKTDLDLLTEEMCKNIQDWINNYPRRMFKGKSSYSLFKKEMKKIS